MTEEIIEKGLLYCAKRCGRGCTREEHDAAVAAGAAAAALLGNGWRFEVWDNLGWHWSVRKGGMSVHPERDQNQDVTGYTAYFNNSFSQILCSGETTQEAIDLALETAEDSIRALSYEIDQIRGTA